MSNPAPRSIPHRTSNPQPYRESSEHRTNPVTADPGGRTSSSPNFPSSETQATNDTSRPRAPTSFASEYHIADSQPSTESVVRKIVKPGSVLFEHREVPAITRQRVDRPPNMDRRHPSSFQQLEKLGEGTYATVSSSEHWALSGSRLTCMTGLQRAQSTDWRTGRAERNPPRQRRGHAEHGDPRDQSDERVEA